MSNYLTEKLLILGSSAAFLDVHQSAVAASETRRAT